MIEGMHMAKLQNFRDDKSKITQNAIKRINLLCDDATFVQSLGFLSGDVQANQVKNSIICGFGKINGQNIGVVAQNMNDEKGSVDITSINKAIGLIDKATKSGIPLVFMFDSAGINLENGVMVMDAYSKMLQTVIRSSGVIPMIGVINGPCVGIQAMLASSLDFLILAGKNAQIGSYSEFVLEANGKYDKQKANKNKGVSFTFDSEQEGITLAKEILSYLPSNNLQKPLQLDGVAGNINDNYKDVMELINGVIDQDSLLTLFGSENYLAAFARIDGNSVAICYAGKKGLCIGACNRIARLIQTANCFNIPVITFNSSTGIMLDNAQEERGILRASTRLAFAYSSSVVPMISVITGTAIGSGYAVLSSKGIGNDYVFAMPDSAIAPLDAQASIRINHSEALSNVDDVDSVKDKLINEFYNNEASPFEVIKQGVIDDIVLPTELRDKLISSLELLKTKRDSVFPKKHSNMPL